MLRWSPKLYMELKISRNPKRYKRILEKGKLVREIFCITLPVNGENIMEIYSSRELWFRYYRQKDMTIVGLALTRENAYKLAAQMCLDLVTEMGDISPALFQQYITAEEVNSSEGVGEKP